jgi:lipoprotein-releasing system permease protein
MFKSKWKTYVMLFGGSLLSEEFYYELSKDPLDEMTYEINQQIEESSMEAIAVKDIYPGLFDWLSLQNMNELIIIILMILVAAINMISTLLIFVLERTRMIGLLKSVGANDSSLMAIFLYYGLFVVVVGILLGNIIGVSLCLLQQQFHFIKLPMDSYYLSFAPISLSFWNILFINIGTILLCFISLLLPLNVIRKINPVKTIQFD